MSISDLFSAAIPGLNGITLDLYTLAIAAIGCALITLGVGVLARFLMHEKDAGDAGGEIDFEGDFQKYARKRYQKELNERTYKTRGIGTHRDMGGE
jgi:hypothetical protein